MEVAQTISMDESENTDANEESFREKCLKELRSDELLLNISLRNWRSATN